MDVNVLIIFMLVIVALVGGTLSPMLMLYTTGRERRLDRIEEIVRHNMVADKLDNIVTRANEVAIAASEVAKNAVNSSDEVKHGIRQIHILVNDNLTAAKKGELNQITILLNFLEKLPSPTVDDRVLITATRIRKAELESQLSNRVIQQIMVDQDIKEAEKAKDDRDGKG